MILGLAVFFCVTTFFWMCAILYMVWDLWRIRKNGISYTDGGWTNIQEKTDIREES